MKEVGSMIGATGWHGSAVIRPEAADVSQRLAVFCVAATQGLHTLANVPHYANIFIEQARMNVDSSRTGSRPSPSLLLETLLRLMA